MDEHEHSQQSIWRLGVVLASDLAEFAKLIALALTIIGFVVVYFPSVRREFEIWTAPPAWYYIGFAKQGRFGHLAYQNPLWDDGVVPLQSLHQLPGNVMVTTVSREPHNGRSAPGGKGTLYTVIPENKCLYVRKIKVAVIPHPKVNGPEQAVWAEAQRVEC